MSKRRPALDSVDLSEEWNPYNYSGHQQTQKDGLELCQSSDLDSAETSSLSVLCKACKVLRFNDIEAGGYEKEDSDGTKVLGFDDHDKRRFRDTKEHTLEYEHHDDLPELPRLAASAKAGCHMCYLLRESIQKDSREQTEWVGYKVVIKLQYIWHQQQHESDENLVALVAILDIFDDSGSVGTYKIIFLSEALSGMLHLALLI